MAILIRGKLYSDWKEADPHISIFRSEQRKFHEQIDHNILSDAKSLHGRYHLLAGYGDPWSHRVLITRTLKQLDSLIPLTLIAPIRTPEGWRLLEQPEANQGDISRYTYLHELYRSSDFLYTGRITIPVLWDTEENRIINNESYEIMQILNEFSSNPSQDTLDLFPKTKQGEMEQMNNFIFDNINNGVYKIGFAPNQKIYEKSTAALFSALDDLEERLSGSRFLLGDNISAADINLFATLIRFDAIYHPYLKCNYKRLQDYANLWLYTKDIYHLPGIKDTVQFKTIMETYYGLEYLNPTQVVPNPPTLDFGIGVETLKYTLYSAPFS